MTPRDITEHAAYPRLGTLDDNFVETAEGDGFQCASAYEAKLALNALNAAYNAGMRHMLDQMAKDTP
jgi:hypothetical protein